MAIAVPAVMTLCSWLLPKLFLADKLLLSLVNFLCGLGVLILYVLNRDLAMLQMIYYGIGLAGMLLCSALVRGIHDWRLPSFIIVPISIAALVMPLVMGREINGARNWLIFSRFSIQPSEIVKLALLIVVPCFMSRRQTLPWLFFAGSCLFLLMLQRDMGTALIYYGTVMLLLFASGSHPLLLPLGLIGGAAGGLMGYQAFAHVKKRIAVWQNPWVDYEHAGYQIVQGLIALASGGLFGFGLGMGSPSTIPVSESDYIFAVICEQFGLIFALCVLAVYAAIIWRGADIALSARHSFHGLLAMGCTVMLALQTFIIIGGVIKLIPLTGVTLPFISYGGSSMVSCLCIIGLLQGVAAINEDDLNEDTHLGMLGGGEAMM